MYGIAYKIESTKRIEILKQLAFRERGGYGVKMQEFTSLAGKKMSVALFLGEENGKLSKKGEAVADTAKVISTSVGPSGPNIVYFENLVKSLEINGLPVDDYLGELSEQINK